MYEIRDKVKQMVGTNEVGRAFVVHTLIFCLLRQMFALSLSRSGELLLAQWPGRLQRDLQYSLIMGEIRFFLDLTS